MATVKMMSIEEIVATLEAHLRTLGPRLGELDQERARLAGQAEAIQRAIKVLKGEAR